MKASNLTLAVTHKGMPRFFYPDGHVLDLDDETDRVLEGHFSQECVGITALTPHPSPLVGDSVSIQLD